MLCQAQKVGNVIVQRVSGTIILKDTTFRYGKRLTTHLRNTALFGGDLEAGRLSQVMRPQSSPCHTPPPRHLSTDNFSGLKVTVKAPHQNISLKFYMFFQLCILHPLEVCFHVRSVHPRGERRHRADAPPPRSLACSLQRAGKPTTHAYRACTDKPVPGPMCKGAVPSCLPSGKRRLCPSSF